MIAQMTEDSTGPERIATHYAEHALSPMQAQLLGAIMEMDNDRFERFYDRAKQAGVL